MLNKRFNPDSKSIFRLDRTQRRSKKRIENNVKTKRYLFEKIKCIVCGSDDFQQLSGKDRVGLCTSIVICKKCGLILTNPRMTQKSYNDFYDKEYRRIQCGEASAKKYFLSQYERGKNVYRFVKNITGTSLKNKFVVEIGTGAGGILKYFKDHDNEVYGNDLGSEYISFGRSQGINLEVGTVSKLKNLKQKPDLVIYSHVVEHLLDPIAEFKKLKKFMKKDSLLYIEVPGIRNIPYSSAMDFLRFIQLAHVFHFTLTSLNNCLQKAGFEFIKGSEEICALYKLKPGKPSKDGFKDDYKESMHFLNKLEKDRSNPFNPLIIKSKLYDIIRKTPLISVARKLYSVLRRI